MEKQQAQTASQQSYLNIGKRQQSTGYMTYVRYYGRRGNGRMIGIRIRTETYMADEQAGFRKERGTRNQITNLRILMQKANEHQQPLFICFVDFKKAFDSIPHETLWVTMIEMGFPGHIINILTKLYSKQKARVKVAGPMSTEFRIRRGVRQGCSRNIVAEMVMRETLEGYEGGVQIGGRR